MILLVAILNKTEYVGQIVRAMAEKNIKGATILDSSGMLKSLSEQSIEPPPIFGSLRQFINAEGNSSKTMFMVLDEDKAELVMHMIRDITKGLDAPNTGIMFTLPVLSAEGI